MSHLMYLFNQHFKVKTPTFESAEVIATLHLRLREAHQKSWIFKHAFPEYRPRG